MKTKANTTFLTVFFSLLFSLNLLAQSHQVKPVSNENSVEVQVYYFHFKTRCETCRTVESEAKQNVESLFGGDVGFQSVDLDEKSGEATGKKLGVNSQTLLIVKGNKKINITNEGFLYAQTNPDKFKKIMEDKIKPLL